MLTAGLKSFFYSFVLSLFVFFGINKVCFDAKKDTTIIPQNNISLFLKSESQPRNSTVNKIFLTKPSQKKENGISSRSRNELSQDIIIEDLSNLSVKAPINSVSPKEKNKQKAETKDITLAKHIPISTKTNNVKEQKNVSAKNQVELSHVEVLRVTENSNIEKEIKLASSDFSNTPQKLAATFPTNVNTAENFASNKDDGNLKNSLVSFTSQSKANNESLLIPLEKSRALPQFATQKIQINPEKASHQIAMASSSKPISAVVDGDLREQSSDKAEKSSPQWQTMAQKNNEVAKSREIKKMYETSKVDFKPTDKDTSLSANGENDSPWVTAKSAAFPKNNEIIKQKYYSDNKSEKEDDSFKLTKILKKEAELQTSPNQEVKVAGEVLDNLIIPIPQDILDDKDLMPNLVSDPKNKKLEDELLAKERGQRYDDIDDIPFIAEEKKQSSAKDKHEEEKSIFKSIASFFSSEEDNSASSNENSGLYVSEDSHPFDNKPSSDRSSVKNKRKILPTEMRLTFQPEKAEISGKTLDWIRAFGQKALEESDVVLEIRIDGNTSAALQQKRLNLLYNILTNLGLGYNKVNTVFTNRAPNTFILRVVKAGEDSDKKYLDPASFYYKER